MADANSFDACKDPDARSAASGRLQGLHGDAGCRPHPQPILSTPNEDRDVVSGQSVGNPVPRDVAVSSPME